MPDSLEAGEVFTLPYRIQALRDFDPEADADATGGGCGSFNAHTKVDYDSECANGTNVPGAATANWNSNWGGDCGGSGGSTDAIQYYRTMNGGGGNDIRILPPGTGVGDPLWCRVETECDECNPNNSSGN